MGRMGPGADLTPQPPAAAARAGLTRPSTGTTGGCCGGEPPQQHAQLTRPFTSTEPRYPLLPDEHCAMCARRSFRLAFVMRSCVGDLLNTPSTEAGTRNAVRAYTQLVFGLGIRMPGSRVRGARDSWRPLASTYGSVPVKTRKSCAVLYLCACWAQGAGPPSGLTPYAEMVVTT